MKKKIFSIALVMAGLLGGTTAFAQAPASAPQAKEQSMTKKDKKDRADRKDKKELKGNKERQRPDMFAGIELTQNQQAELQKLRESIKADRQKASDDAKAAKKDLREKRQNAKKEYLAKIKNILTPEQYVKYLENFYTNSFNQGGHKAQGPKMAQGHHGKKGKMDRRDDRKKGDRPQGKRQDVTPTAAAQAAK